MLKESRLEKTLKKMMTPKCKSEYEEQVAVMEWAEKLSIRHPYLSFLFHIPNGGYRDPITASRLKRAGVKPNVPDLFLAVPMNGFSGLFVEMKSLGGTTPKKQALFHQQLRVLGYGVVVCKGAESAKAAIRNYLYLEGLEDLESLE